MGTRNLTFVQHDGKYRIAQYGQWDGDPGGQGQTVLDFAREHLQGEAGRKRFIRALDNIRMIPLEEVAALYKSTVPGIDESGFVTREQAAQFKKAYPGLDRDMAAEVLEYVMKSKDKVTLKDETAFAGDSLMCEWAYVIDLDKNTLEVFKGFNKQPLDKSERFASISSEKEHRGSNQYHPIRLLCAWKLGDLPSDETFCAVGDEGADDA